MVSSAQLIVNLGLSEVRKMAINRAATVARAGRVSLHVAMVTYSIMKRHQG